MLREARLETANFSMALAPASIFATADELAEWA